MLAATFLIAPTNAQFLNSKYIPINHQPDATTFRFIILTFIYSSKCFGRSPPIIRSSMTAVKASGFTFVSWWQPCCVRGRVGPTTNTARLSPRYEDKTRGCFRIINWKINCCIWLVIYLNCTMMHGLTNLKCFYNFLSISICTRNTQI